MAIMQACAESGVTRVLCDERDLEYRLGTMDTYRAARLMASRAPRVARVAIVCGPSQAADAHFWETVAVNRGLTAAAFADLAAARRWLGLPDATGRPFG